jgi:hypothetical protein
VFSLKGKKFGDQPQIEVNGTVITPPFGFSSQSPKKISVNGQATELHLQTGPNRIRIISNGLRSNLLVIEM